MKLIDADRLIKDLMNQDEDNIHIPWAMINWFINEYVKKQPQVNQWIPCKDKLPPKPLFGHDGYIVQQDNVIEPYSAYWNGEKWTDDDNNECYGIIAWMPLPPKYEG